MSQKKSNKNRTEDQVVEAIEITPEKKFNIESYIAENQKTLSYIVGGLVVIAALYFGYKYIYLGPKEKQAVNAMYKAEALFAQDSFAVALENSNPEIEGFLDIMENYSGTKSANTAKYYAGICYLNLGNFDEAVNYLNKYSAPDDLTQVMKNGALGDAFADQGDKDKALSQYIKAAQLMDNDLTTPYYLNKAALLSYVLGKNEDAVKRFEEIISKYPNSAESKDAEKYLARIQ
ncbi:MAG: tetratricopeptide repeat protein [Saprospiraceae bacterium]